jgi:hypothetical protein
MKKCDSCGWENNDAAMMCQVCGSPGFRGRTVPISESEGRKVDPDELPAAPFAQKDGNSITLKCRTPEEAYLVCDELERADILTILPDENVLVTQFEREGYVEVRVSAKAYESLGDLRSIVEFQYKRLRAERRLSSFAKLVGLGSGMMVVPGIIVFASLLSSYRRNGFDRRAKDLKFWFFLGLAVWLLLVVTFIAASPAGTR